jgi:hypothetical protein
MHVECGAIVEHGKLMLPPPLDSRDRSTSQAAQPRLPETAANEWVQHLGARDTRTGRGARERPSRMLDFGKLRHKCQRTRVTRSTQARAIDSAALGRRE